MRRFSLYIVMISLLLTLAPTPAAAVTSQQWNWMKAAEAAEAQGDLALTVDYWLKIAHSMRADDLVGCGEFARRSGRTLDSLGRYAEAVAAFDLEFECWGQLSGYEEGMKWDKVRAEQIRPEIRAFVSRTTDGAPVGKLAKNEPAFGTMLGATIDQDPAIKNNLSKVAEVYGKPYGMVLVYAPWGEPLPTVSTAAAKAAGSALQVGWQPEHGLAAVKDDAYVRGFIRSLKAYGHPVFLRFGGEMNGDWTQWFDTDPSQYIAKFRLIAQIVRQENATNVAMLWSPNYVGPSYVNTHDYYPGDEWVDWVGINAYHDSLFKPQPDNVMMGDLFYQGTRTNPLDKVKDFYQRYATRKPLMMAETGFGWLDQVRGKDQTAWAADALQRFYGYAPLIYPRLKAINYFNKDFSWTPSRYMLSASPTMTAAFKQVTGSSWYLSSPAATSPVLWRPVEQATLTGTTRLAAYVNLGAGVSRVDYLVDGQVKATARQLPWEAAVDFSGLTGTRTLTVRAYDKNGQLGHERHYSFDGSAIKVKLNGRYVDFDQPPVLLDGRVLVPARAILEALGAEIAWDARTETVTATKAGSVLKLQIGNPVPLKDGAPLKALDVPAKLIGGRTLVPARFVSENYDMKVDWDQANWTVIISPKQ